MTGARTELRYFGPPQGRLFGCYHPSVAAARSGVVLCNPFGQDYSRAHRALHMLASRLASTGLPCLRFDYHGTGDSAGNGEAGNIQRWLDDTARAIEELKLMSGVSEVSVVGLRLGASLALLASAGRADVRRLVLWDPVVDGESYLRTLLAAHRDWEHSLVRAEPRVESDCLEALGFPVSRELRRDLEQLHLGDAVVPAGSDVLLVADGRDAAMGSLQARLETGTGEVSLRAPLEEGLNLDQNQLGSVWVPGQTIESVVSWFARGAP